MGHSIKTGHRRNNNNKVRHHVQALPFRWRPGRDILPLPRQIRRYWQNIVITILSFNAVYVRRMVYAEIHHIVTLVQNAPPACNV